MDHGIKRAGAPTKVVKSDFLSILLEYKDIIILNSGKLLSKSNEKWSEIATRYPNLSSGNAVYSYVSCNRQSVRYDLEMARFGRCIFTHPVQAQMASLDNSQQDRASEGLPINSREEVLARDSNLQPKILFTIKAEEFLKWTHSIPRHNTKKLQYRTRFNDDYYKKWISDQLNEAYKAHGIYNKTGRMCGFNIKYHYLSKELKSGGCIKGFYCFPFQ